MGGETIVRMALAVHRLIEGVYCERTGKWPVDSLPEDCVLLMEKLSDVFFHDGWDSISAQALSLLEEKEISDESVGSSED